MFCPQFWGRKWVRQFYGFKSYPKQISGPVDMFVANGIFRILFPQANPCHACGLCFVNVLNKERTWSSTIQPRHDRDPSAYPNCLEEDACRSLHLWPLGCGLSAPCFFILWTVGVHVRKDQGGEPCQDCFCLGLGEIQEKQKTHDKLRWSILGSSTRTSFRQLTVN